MGRRKILGSFIIGALIGSLVGLLTTPYSGRYLRKKIIKRTRKFVGGNK